VELFYEQPSWEPVGRYSDYTILALKNKRRLVDRTTGRIVVEYEV